MKKLLYLLPVIMLLSAGCVKSEIPSEPSSVSSQSQSESAKCAKEKIVVQDILTNVKILSKQDVSAGMVVQENVSLWEVFYSPKLNQCMFMLYFDAVMKDNRQAITMILYKVPKSASVFAKEDQVAMVLYLPSDMPRFQSKIDEFNQTVQSYR